MLRRTAEAVIIMLNISTKIIGLTPQSSVNIACVLQRTNLVLPVRGPQVTYIIIIIIIVVVVPRAVDVACKLIGLN
jgi:hypothetical protein